MKLEVSFKDNTEGSLEIKVADMHKGLPLILNIYDFIFSLILIFRGDTAIQSIISEKYYEGVKFNGNLVPFDTSQLEVEMFRYASDDNQLRIYIWSYDFKEKIVDEYMGTWEEFDEVGIKRFDKGIPISIERSEVYDLGF